VSKYAWTERGV
jgi:hypothetical protein